MALLKGAKSVHWAQDLYPVAETLAVIRPQGWLARGLRWLSTFCCSGGRIVCIGRCMRERLTKRGIRAARLALIPNWAGPGTGAAAARTANPFSPARRIERRAGRYVFSNFGLAHHFDAIIEAAAILALQCPEVSLLLVVTAALPQLRSAGTSRTRRPAQCTLSAVSAEKNNWPRKPERGGHSASLCMRENMYGLVVPSKVYGILAAGRPCVFLGPAESEIRASRRRVRLRFRAARKY
ncbi:MAG: hypothetical protein U0Y68_21090 [Blastocatellia bacterium]